MALPIPVSMITWIGTLISVANIGATGTEGIFGTIHEIVAVLSMILAGTYAISYGCSLYRIKKVKKITCAFFSAGFTYSHNYCFYVDLEVL